ncbi:MAG: hypothetical protein MI924_04405 [Chloroflexales bacterium]|nr:hypothetical protein [Chloroflexales bacterium]
MGIFDRLLKQLVADYRHDFAAWLLGSEVDAVEPLTVELPAELLRADMVFHVQLSDGRATVLHIEFQGRGGHRLMPWRMLDYMGRLAEQHQVPVTSAVLYLERNAGSRDTGRHQHRCADGSVALAWNYQVIHLWRMNAEDLLMLGRRSLLPLVAFTPFQRPDETLPQIIAAIRTEPDQRRQILLLKQLIDLLQDEELIAMTEQLLSTEDLEELKRFPALWRDVQRIQRETAREYLLDALATRFNPPAQDYRQVEKAIAAIDDLERLNMLFRRALLAADFASFARETLGEAPLNAAE